MLQGHVVTFLPMMETCGKYAPQDRQHNQVEGGRLKKVSTLSGGIVDPVQRTSTVPVFDGTLGHDLGLWCTPHGSQLHRSLTSSRRRESSLRLVHHICAPPRAYVCKRVFHFYDTFATETSHILLITQPPSSFFR